MANDVVYEEVAEISFDEDQDGEADGITELNNLLGFWNRKTEWRPERISFYLYPDPILGGTGKLQYTDEVDSIIESGLTALQFHDFDKPGTVNKYTVYNIFNSISGWRLVVTAGRMRVIARQS